MAGLGDCTGLKRRINSEQVQVLVNGTSNKQKADVKIQEQVTVMGRCHLRPSRRTLSMPKTFTTWADGCSLPSVFKAVSIAHKLQVNSSVSRTLEIALTRKLKEKSKK